MSKESTNVPQSPKSGRITLLKISQYIEHPLAPPVLTEVTLQLLTNEVLGFLLGSENLVTNWCYPFFVPLWANKP